MFLEELPKERFASSGLLQFETAEPVYFVPSEPEVAIGSDHLGILLRARVALCVSVVLNTVDLDDDALMMRQKH
jgi:hypothetical protein